VRTVPNREAKYSENVLITQNKVNPHFKNYENGPAHLSAVFVLRHVMRIIELIVIIPFFSTKPS
jgi:hypothetical protein